MLLFDEPVSGLDPEGIVWIRTLLRSLAQEGRTVFVSSRLMSEMALTADHLLPANAGQAILNIHPTSGSLAPWTGFAVLCAWTLTTLATAAWLINRRDA